MKLLILSCNTGGGHNAAAASIKEYLVKQGVEVEIRDALGFRSPMKSKIISGGHVFVYKKIPRLFGAGYRFFEQHPPKKGKNSVMYDTVKNDAENIYAYLQENPCDAILCTHLFASMIVTEMQKRYGMRIPNYLVITDYTCYPGVDESDADVIFIPHEKLVPEFLADGVAEDRLVPSGIPVRASFYKKEHPEDAKRALELPVDQKVVLMMCGSMGCGPLPRLARLITEKMGEDAILTVICGSNKKLFEKFQKMNNDRIHVVGFTDQIALYMDAADVVLTKPGGLSSTESAVKGLPMVLINAVPGCETKNMDFFLENGFGITAEGVEALSDTVVSLLSDENEKERLRACQNASFSESAASVIGDRILSEVHCFHG